MQPDFKHQAQNSDGVLEDDDARFIQRITSAKNPFIKRTRQLVTSAKERRSSGLTLLDGVHLCDAYLRAGFEPVSVIVSDSAEKNPEVQDIIDRLDLRVEYISLPDSLFDSINVVEHGVGVAFVVQIPELSVNSDVEDLSVNALLLDGVQDPGNVGTLLRTAAAAGIKRAYFSPDTASAWSPKVLRAGMGAQFTIEIIEGVDLKHVVKNATIPVYATSLKAEQSIYEKDLTGESAWLFGAEGRGVSDELVDLCGKNTVIIPQAAGVESLNVAAAAAVCLFEQRRQQINN